MGIESFFDKQTEESKLKAEIVSKYFSGWANVMASMNTKGIAYLDLFSGPGRYEDGSPSTPLLVLRKAINHMNGKVAQKVRIVFNDSKPKFFHALEKEVRNFPELKKLHIPPRVFNFNIAADVVEKFEVPDGLPTLSFIDPWGYKGLFLPLVKILVDKWGCDCIFFFNFRRINAAIENRVLQSPIGLVFTEEILDQLRTEIRDKTPREREALILGKIRGIFREWGMKYFLPFVYKNKTGRRIAHCLIFITKHIKGYKIMLHIMGACSSGNCQEVPSFEFNPVPRLPMEKPLDDLKKTLVRDFSGRSILMADVFAEHQIYYRPCLEKNYRKAMTELETEGSILTNRAERKTRAGSFPEDMLVIFPKYR